MSPLVMNLMRLIETRVRSACGDYPDLEKEPNSFNSSFESSHSCDELLLSNSYQKVYNQNKMFLNNFL